MAEGPDFQSILTQMDSFLAVAKVADTEAVRSDTEERKLSEQDVSFKTAPLTPKSVGLSARRYNEIVQEALSAPPKKRSSKRRAYKRTKSESLTQQQIISAVRECISLEHQKLYNMFGALDGKKRGRITRKELGEGIASVANGLSEFEIKRFVRWVDTDQDGLISFQDFWKVFETNHTDKSKQTWYPRSPQTSPNSQASMPSMEVFTQYQMTSPLQPTTQNLQEKIDLEAREEIEQTPPLPKLKFVDHALREQSETTDRAIAAEGSMNKAEVTRPCNVLVTIHGGRNIFAYTDTGTPRIVNVMGTCSSGEQEFELPLIVDTSHPTWNTTFNFAAMDDLRLVITLISEEGYRLGTSCISIELGQEWESRTIVLTNESFQQPLEVPEIAISVAFENEVAPVEVSRMPSLLEAKEKGTLVSESQEAVELHKSQEANHSHTAAVDHLHDEESTEDVELKHCEASSQQSHGPGDQYERGNAPLKRCPGGIVPWMSIVEASQRTAEQSADPSGPSNALSSFLEASSSVTSPSSSVLSADAAFTEHSDNVDQLSNEEIAEVLTLVEHYKESETENETKLCELREAVNTLKQQLLYSKDAQMKLRCKVGSSADVVSMSEESFGMSQEETSKWKLEAMQLRSCRRVLLDQFKMPNRPEAILGILSTILAQKADHQCSERIRSCVSYFQELEVRAKDRSESESVLQNLILELTETKALHDRERELNHKHHEAQNVLKDQLHAALDDKRSCVKSLQNELEEERINWKSRDKLQDSKIQAMELREHEFLSKEESLSKLLVAKSKEIEALHGQVKKLRYSLMAESQQKDLVAQLTSSETALAEEVSSLQSQCSSLQQQNQTLTETVTQMRETMQRNEANCRELLSALDTVKYEKKQLMKNLGQHIERIRELEAKSAQHTCHTEGANEQVTLLESKLSTLANENDEMRVQMSKHVKEKESLQLRLEEATLKEAERASLSKQVEIPRDQQEDLRQRVVDHERQILSLFQKNQAMLSLNTVMGENEKALKNRIAQLEELQVSRPSFTYASALARSHREVIKLRDSIDKPAIKLLLAGYAKAQDRTFSMLLSLLRRSKKTSPEFKISPKKTVACTVVGIDDPNSASELEINTGSCELLIKGKRNNRWFRFDRVLVTGGAALDSEWMIKRFEPSEFLGKIEEGPFTGILVCMGPTAGETTTQTISTLFDILGKADHTNEITLSCIELSESREVFDLLKGPEVLKRLGADSNRVANSEDSRAKLEDLDVTVVKVSSKREASLVAAMAASNRITASAERRLSHPRTSIEPNSHMILQVEVCRQTKLKEHSKFCIIELGCIENRNRNPFLTECAEDLASLFNDQTMISIDPPSTKLVSLVRDCCRGQASLCAHVSLNGNAAVGTAEVLLALEFARSVRTEPIAGLQDTSRGAKVAKAILARSELDQGVLHSLFMKWDRNKTGKLSRQEFRKGMYTVDRTLPREDVDEFFNASAEDGELSFHEFFKLLGEARKPIGKPGRCVSSQKKGRKLYQALSPEHARLVQPLQDLSHERRRASFNAYRVTKFQDTLRRYS